MPNLSNPHVSTDLLRANILAKGPVSQAFLEIGLSDFGQAMEWMKQLSYGRNPNKQNLLTVFDDGSPEGNGDPSRPDTSNKISRHKESLKLDHRINTPFLYRRNLGDSGKLYCRSVIKSKKTTVLQTGNSGFRLLLKPSPDTIRLASSLF